jgi:rRNA processing protein Gar1
VGSIRNKTTNPGCSGTSPNLPLSEGNKLIYTAGLSFRRMREIGVALRIARSGMLIIKLSNQPNAGQVVVDSRNRPVGRIVEVFGPVKSPYASARPLSDLAKHVLGQKVFSKGEADS